MPRNRDRLAWPGAAAGAATARRDWRAAAAVSWPISSAGGCGRLSPPGRFSEPPIGPKRTDRAPRGPCRGL